jgi:hypothetical protein
LFVVPAAKHTHILILCGRIKDVKFVRYLPNVVSAGLMVRMRPL